MGGARPGALPDRAAGRRAGGVPGGAHNPLGARAHYLWQGNKDTLYRIHGTLEPDSIGKSVSSGCIRMINQDVIDLYGRDKTLDIVKGWVANDVDVMANDVLLIDAVDAGTCDVALVNHYYLARELEDRPDLNVKLYWASQEGAGTHVNLSGVVLAKNAPNKANAVKLMEWLVSEKAQHMYADMNYEYPLLSEVKNSQVASGAVGAAPE